MTISDTAVAGRTGAAADLRRAPLSEVRAVALAWAGIDESRAYDCLHGHVPKHLAMLGPWCVERTRPGGPH